MKNCIIRVNGKNKKFVINARPSEMIELEIDPAKENYGSLIEIEAIEKEGT